MENRKLHQDVFVGLGSLVFVAWVLFLNRKLPLGSALMPHLLCGILALLGIIILVQGLNKTKRQNPEEMKELLNADIPFFRRRKHLDVPEGIEMHVIRQAFGHQLDQ